MAVPGKMPKHLYVVRRQPATVPHVEEPKDKEHNGAEHEGTVTDSHSMAAPDGVQHNHASASMHSMPAQHASILCHRLTAQPCAAG